uniref:Calponin-homology (CH) domain-containing protein n=1 Tax=Timema monikensis TaxID=170555 RepID=A0A7R9E1N2_9NEOP|nr:unnamed protein product [Timema monikensis]
MRPQKQTSTSSTVSNGHEADLEDIWDEKLLRQLLEKCSDYEGRRQIRARLRIVMAEQKACAEVVAAALADEDSPSHSEKDDHADSESNVERGESLLLPFLVEHLRSSLHQQQHSEDKDSHSNMVDSGTESGEDLKFLAAGLRDSLELEKGEGLEPLGPSLLAEVGSALARLQASLQLGGEIALEPERREALLQLVSRLQASLRLPAPPWGDKTPTPALHTTVEGGNRRANRQNRHTVGVSREELADARRLLERKKLIKETYAPSEHEKDKPSSDGNNTVPQSQETLAYPVIKQYSAEDVSSSDLSVTAPVWKAFRPVRFVPRKSRSGASVSNNSTARPFIAYSHQQHGWATSQEQRRSSCSNIEQNSYSKLSSQIDMKTNSIGNDTITESNKDNLDGKQRLIQNMENNNLNVLENENLDKPVALIHKEYRPGRKGEETVKPINKSLSQTSSLDSSSPQRSDSGNSVSDNVNSKPILSHHSSLDSSYSKSSTPQRSDSGASVPDKHINKQLAFYSSADNASAPLKSESGTSIDERAQQKQLSHSSSASSSTSRTSSHSSGMTSVKAHVPQQPNSHSSHSKSSLSSSMDSGKNSKESTPQEMIKQTLNTAEIIPDLHRTASKNSREPSAFVPYLRSLAQNTHVPLCQSISLDETAISSLVPHNKLRGSLQHKPISHTHSLDSSKSDYDPSVILFTPEQSVQIAIHKAAINKQISIEEEKRQNLSQLYNSEDEDSDIEEEGEVSSDESRISDSEEEVEETDSTVIQAKDISKNTGDSYKSQAPQNTSQQVDAKNRIEIKPKNESQRVNYCNTKTENTYAKPFVPLVNSKSQAIKNSQNIEKNINGTNPNHSVNNSQDINVTKDVVPRHTNKDQDMVLGKLGVEQNKTIYSGDKNENYMPTSGADTQQTTSAQSKITQRPNSQNYRVPDTHGSHSNKTFQQQPFQSYKNVEHIVEGGTNNTTKQNQMHTVEARAQMFQQKAFSTPQYAYQKQNENSRPKEDSSVSSAQRLLQMATEDNKSSYRTQGRGERKVKMKRANTIDIPKPLNFYSVEGDTDYSSDEDYEGTGEPKNVNSSNNNQHRAAYLALRGPIRVGGVGTATDDGKVIPPVLKPRTESDRKFLAFLEQHSTGKSKSSLWNPDAIKSSGYSPVSRGGMHWNNRFSNIKTAFESPGETGKSQPVQGKPVVAGPASARKFWQSADDSVAVVKNNPASANDPKLSRQGSIFLRKLFEQKDQEKHEQQAKLPWTEKASEVPEDAVVVGSLTVAASHKGIRGTVLSKKQLFTSPHSPSAQHLVNTFSHAPLSAFKPIEKKVRNVVETNNQPWATPSVSGTVKQLAAQKFCTDTTQQSNSIPNTGLKTPSKQKLGFTPYSHSKQDIITSPISPTLPWTKDGFHAANDNGVLKPTLAKFENLSRETSPTPIPPPLPRSRSQERIAIPSTLSLFSPKHNSAPAPPPRAFVPPPNPLNLTPEQSFAISQGSYISSSLCVSKLSPPRIPSPPTLAAPNLVHNYDQTQENYCISDDYGENQEVYDTLSGYPQQEYIHEHNTSIPPKQTYSGSVTSRSAIYPSAIRNSKKVNQHPQKELPQDKLATPVRPKMSLPLQLSKTLDSPDGSLPSPEAFTAFSRVMTGPISQQAVVVTQTTHRRGDEELEGKSSAARNLTSVLTRFSSPSSESADISNEKSPVPMISVYKGNDDSTESDLYKSNSPHKNGASPNILSPSNYQDESFKKQMSRSRSPRYEKYKEGITRHNSDPNIRGMISDEQFSTNQQQLQQEANILGSRNGLSPRQNEGSNKPPAHSYDSNSITSQSLEPSRYQLSNYVRPISTESLITATSREELQESGESVLTTRLQIPVYNNVRSNSLQDISPTKSDNSDCGYSVSPATTASVSPSLVLRKSESWHQLAAEQTKRRPLSLALPDLPTAGSISGNRRSHPALPKTKSSHSLAFPKQFEAAMTPESVKKNQKKVEAYFNMSSSAKIGASSQTQSVQGQSGKLHLSTSFDKKSPINKATKQIPPSPDILDLDINLENVDEAFESLFKAAVSDGVKHKQPKRPQVLNLSYDERPEVSSHRLQPNELRRSGSSPQFAMKQQAWEESSGVRTTLARNLAPYDSARHSESTARSSVKDGDTVTHTEVTTKKSSFSTSAVGKTRASKAPLGQAISPFAKFQQLDKQTSKSAPSSPKTPGTAGAPLFKFTDPKLSRSASGVKDKLLYWSQSKTKEYKNIQIENFSTSWSNGLAFCALIHHFCPDAFDYETLKPEERRKNFELAFRVADDKAGIAPLLDVEDMVMMRKPDWKCVFTYVQSIYRRFKDED